METLSPNWTNDCPALDVPRWYAVYTKPRHEKAVSEHLELRAVEAFFPAVTVESQWKDRKVRIEKPVFPGYVFTRIPFSERNKMFAVPGIVRVISYRGAPAPIEDIEIEAVRLCLRSGAKLKSHPFLAIGERVRVRSGPMEGLEGLVMRHKGDSRIVVSIALIHQSVAVEIGSSLLESLETATLRC